MCSVFCPRAVLAWLAELQQNLARRIHFGDDVIARVGDPEVVLGIELDPVGPRGQALAEATDKLTAVVELVNGDRAPVKHKDVSVRVECDGADVAKGSIRRQRKWP